VPSLVDKPIEAQASPVASSTQVREEEAGQALEGGASLSQRRPATWAANLCRVWGSSDQGETC
jgi:hypothetical protein